MIIAGKIKKLANFKNFFKKLLTNLKKENILTAMNTARAL